MSRTPRCSTKKSCNFIRAAPTAHDSQKEFQKETAKANPGIEGTSVSPEMRQKLRYDNTGF